MISINHVSKTFLSGFKMKSVKAVSNINVTIDQGEIFGIVGPNGAGKSTLLKMMMGFIRPTSGSITMFGDSPLNPKVRKNLGYLPENPYYYDYLSAEDLMKFSGKTSGMNDSQLRKRMDELLSALNLGHARKRKLRTYSKGMTQRAGICFALVHNPELVILDEPMSGLDPLGRRLVVDLIFNLKEQNKTVLFCSHILNDVERLCDRMAIMDKGNLKALYSKDEIGIKFGSARVMVDAIPDTVLPLFQGLRGEVISKDDQTIIQCEKKNISHILDMLYQNDIKVRSVDTASEVLENIFLQLIEGNEGYDTSL